MFSIKYFQRKQKLILGVDKNSQAYTQLYLCSPAWIYRKSILFDGRCKQQTFSGWFVYTMAFRLMQGSFAVHVCQQGKQCPNQKSKIKHVHIQNFYIQLEKGMWCLFAVWNCFVLFKDQLYLIATWLLEKSHLLIPFHLLISYSYPPIYGFAKIINSKEFLCIYIYSFIYQTCNW